MREGDPTFVRPEYESLFETVNEQGTTERRLFLEDEAKRKDYMRKQWGETKNILLWGEKKKMWSGEERKNLRLKWGEKDINLE